MSTVCSRLLYLPALHHVFAKKQKQNKNNNKQEIIVKLNNLTFISRSHDGQGQTWRNQNVGIVINVVLSKYVH